MSTGLIDVILNRGKQVFFRSDPVPPNHDSVQTDVVDEYVCVGAGRNSKKLCINMGINEASEAGIGPSTLIVLLMGIGWVLKHAVHEGRLKKLAYNMLVESLASEKMREKFLKVVKSGSNKEIDDMRQFLSQIIADENAKLQKEGISKKEIERSKLLFKNALKIIASMARSEGKVGEDVRTGIINLGSVGNPLGRLFRSLVMKDIGSEDTPAGKDIRDGLVKIAKGEWEIGRHAVYILGLIAALPNNAGSHARSILKELSMFSEGNLGKYAIVTLQNIAAKALSGDMGKDAVQKDAVGILVKIIKETAVYVEKDSDYVKRKAEEKPAGIVCERAVFALLDVVEKWNRLAEKAFVELGTDKGKVGSAVRKILFESYFKSGDVALDQDVYLKRELNIKLPSRISESALMWVLAEIAMTDTWGGKIIRIRLVDDPSIKGVSFRARLEESIVKGADKIEDSVVEDIIRLAQNSNSIVVKGDVLIMIHQLVTKRSDISGKFGKGINDLMRQVGKFSDAYMAKSILFELKLEKVLGFKRVETLNDLQTLDDARSLAEVKEGITKLLGGSGGKDIFPIISNIELNGSGKPIVYLCDKDRLERIREVVHMLEQVKSRISKKVEGK